MSYVPQEDRGTRAGGKSQLKAVMLLIFIHLFSLDINPPLVGVDLRLGTLCREIAGQHADNQNSCFSNGNPYIYPPLVGVDLRLRTLCREIAGQHADTQNSCFSNGNLYIYPPLVGRT